MKAKNTRPKTETLRHAGEQVSMTALLRALAPREGYNLTALPDVRILRSDRPLSRTPVLYDPGIVIVCRAERSQHQNRAMAMKMLKAKLYEMEQQKREQAQAAYESAKGQIAFGSQIRSYVLQPYQLVKDLRTEHETAAVQDVLDGDLDPFIEAFLLKHADQQPQNTPPSVG